MGRLKVSTLTMLLGTTAMSMTQNALAQDVGSNIDEIVVRGVNIPDEKRATSEISAVLDEESFQRTGDSDIASALGRVTGLSITEGKFVVVRGLNERYSSVTLDGSPLPSPEPLRRVVPLDIIPTSILSGSLVQKTFSPQLSGEFGGGTIELRTKPIPDETYFNISASIGLDTVTNLSRGLTYDGGSSDWAGFDDGTRSASPEIEQAFFGVGPDSIGNLPEFGLPLLSSAQQNILDTSIDSTNTTVLFRDNIPANWDFSLAGGTVAELSDEVVFGINLAGSFGNSWQTRDGRREQGLTGSAEFADAAPFGPETGNLPNDAAVGNFFSTTQDVTSNLAGTFGFEIGDNHTITSTNLLLRSTAKDARTLTFIDGDNDGVLVRDEFFDFFERQVWQTQLRGEHVIPSLNDLTIAWRGAFGQAERDAPLNRAFRTVQTQPGGAFQQPFGNPDVPSAFALNAATVSFSEVDDTNIDAGVDFTLPQDLFGQAGEIKFGYAFTDKERDSFVRDLQYLFDEGFGIGSALSGVRNDVLVSDAAGTDALDLTLINSLVSLDNATSALQVHAGYLGLDYEVGDYVRVAAGFRYEVNDLNTLAFATSQPQASFSDANALSEANGLETLDQDFFLPAVTVTWNPLDDIQVRAGFSQTITRPQFRELTPATFLDDDTDQLILGNPFLRITEIDNYDARIEYYFGRGQFVTIGGFYKDLTNPIELTSFRTTIGLGQTFVNAPSAELYGFELEFEKTMAAEDLVDWSFVQGLDLLLKTNYTFSQSNVSADGEVTLSGTASAATSGVTPIISDASGRIVDGRSLQGQSDHLFNLQLGVEDSEADMRATLLVNYASQRIRQTENITGVNAADIIPAVLERPPVSLDLVFSKGLDMWGGGWEVGLQVRNILGDDYEATQEFADGSVAEFDVYPLGRRLSASISKSF